MDIFLFRDQEARDLNSWRMKQNRLLLKRSSTMNLLTFLDLSLIVEKENNFLSLPKITFFFHLMRFGKLLLIGNKKSWRIAVSRGFYNFSKKWKENWINSNIFPWTISEFFQIYEEVQTDSVIELLQKEVENFSRQTNI